MRVLHVITGLGGGGAEVALYRLCTASSERREDIVVSLTTEGMYGEQLRAAGISVQALGMRRRQLSFAGILRLVRIIREAKPDIVQTWLYHGDLVGGIAARLAGCRRVIWSIHNSSVDPTTTPFGTRFVRGACALLSRFVPWRIISNAQSAKTIHANIGYASDRIVFVPYGYDGETFRPDPEARSKMRRDVGLPPDEPIVGMVARFDPQKDVNNLLDALDELVSTRTRFTCLLVGMGMTPDNAVLDSAIKARSLEARIRLLGQRSDVPVVMNALDFLVLPSAYGEAFPNVVAEAMACGTPVVATDVGDSSFIIGDTGWVVPPRNSHALANAVAKALTELGDSKAHAQRQAACRERIVTNFTQARMVTEYDAIWREAIESVQ